jgi:hypothetical protein
MNGTTIPQNVANALMVNGVSVTQVIANGVAVWNQSLGPTVTVGWSGNSLYYASATYIYGLETSGLLVRVRSGPGVGAWVTSNQDGTFTGLSTACYLAWGGEFSAIGGLITYGGTGFIMYSGSDELFTGGPAQGYGLAWGTGVRSSSTASILETSGGLVRVVLTVNSSRVYNTWISLH